MHLLAARGEEKGKQLVDEIKVMDVKVDFVKTDMSIEKAVMNFVDFAIKKYGKIDYYLGNQGVIYEPKMFADTPEADVDKVFSVNVKGAFFGMKHVIKQFLKQSSEKYDHYFLFISYSFKNRLWCILCI
ncbi:SDR family NAD(P)-dependent oxidoreductase [Bacillus sp. Bva_UNVM-123]